MIDCYELPSWSSFDLAWMEAVQVGGDVVILIHGIEWLVELCQGEQLLGIDIRQIVKQIE